MKNIFFSVLLLLSVLFFLAKVGEAAIPCNVVIPKAATCVQYATGKAATPGAACCNGLKQLAQSVRSVNDKKDICNCLKGAGKSMGVQDKYLSKIPGLCGINVGFPISSSTNCQLIH